MQRTKRHFWNNRITANPKSTTHQILLLLDKIRFYPGKWIGSWERMKQNQLFLFYWYRKMNKGTSTEREAHSSPIIHAILFHKLVHYFTTQVQNTRNGLTTSPLNPTNVSPSFNLIPLSLVFKNLLQTLWQLHSFLLQWGHLKCTDCESYHLHINHTTLMNSILPHKTKPI